MRATLMALAAALAVWAVPAHAQLQLARVEGAVVDAEGRPAAGVSVTLTDPLGATLRSVVADARGRFAFPEIAPGRYALRAATAGGAPLDVPISVEGAWPVRITLRLPPSFREELEVESSVPTGSVATRTGIGGDSIASVPIAVRSRGLQEVVATMPGWSTEDNGLLHSRGVDDGFLYVVDGVPVYERLDQTSGVAPDAATLDAMSVVTGYVPPEFGYKAGGVIELRTRTAGESWTGSYEAGLGTESSRDGSAAVGGPLARGATLWLAASGQRTDRFLDPVHPDNLHNTGAVLSASGQLDAAVGAGDRVTAGFGYGRSSFDVPNTAAQEAAGQDQRQRLGQGFLTSSWQRTWPSATVSQVAGYRRGSDARLGASAFDTPLTAAARRSLTRNGLLAGVAHQRGRHLVKAGVEAQHLDLSERFEFAVTDEEAAAEAGLSPAALTHDAGDPFRFSAARQPILWSAYVQDSWQAGAALTVAAGLRFDHSRLLLTRSQTSPRAGVAYRAGARTTLRGSASRFFQPPQAENLLLSSSTAARALSPFAGVGAGGGAEVEPERQWAFEAGIDHRLSSRLRLDAAVWRRRIVQVADPNVFFGTTLIFPNTVAKGRAQGLDVRLEWPSRQAWSGYANLSVAKVRQTGPITGGLFLEDDFPAIGEGTEFVPDHDQRIAAAGGVTWTGPRGVTVSVTGRHESGRPVERDDEGLGELRERPGADLVDFDAGRVRGRTVVSMMAGARLAAPGRYALTVRAALFNVFNQRYAYNFGNPFSGTHFGAPRAAAIALRVERR